MPVINTNMKALDAQESMRTSNLAMSQAMERLSTGKKINSAKDDAAGLAITNRMTSQIRGLAKAIGNVNDAISMTQTAEGALGNVGDILQRMRELSVQAASGTMTDSDRSSIQNEVSQLKSQIDLIAKTTNHNNIKLLDGSAQNITIQTGINQNETMKIGFASVQAKDIGVGSRAVVSSVGGTSASTSGALVEGNLYLNGVGVGASLAQDDSASSASASASAIAKAAAINRVSNLSGVYAKAGSTVVSGASMSAATAVSSGTVTINGVATDTFSTSLDTSLTRKALVNAINAKTSITGVTATDTGDDTLGVTLEAADGRNINLVHTFNSGTIGIKPTGTTFVGSYSLYTLDGRDINVSSVTGSSTAVSTSGLTLGTYKSNQAIFNSYARTAQSAAPSITTTGLLDSSSLILNGVAIGAALNTDDTSSAVVGNSTRASSAIAIAAAINRSSGQSGVTAVANANVLQGTGFTPVNVTKALIYVNGVAITANTMSLNGVIDSFNAKSGQTGVVASQWGSGMQLIATDGRNISIKSTAAASTFGLTGLTFGTNGSSYKTWTSTVSLRSDNAFTVKSGKTGVTNLELLGLRQGTFGASDNGLKVNQIDVTTIGGASQAITAIDAAINTVSQAQAVSGAYNNRFDSIVNNLSETNQNITASRSRILDTDYATETTSLAKQQIISQAATAMLAQANQSSQSILSLLK